MAATKRYGIAINISGVELINTATPHLARSLWPHYSRQSDLLVFVVDSRDQERLPEARLELERVARSLGGRVPVLVLANKQDLPGTVGGLVTPSQLNPSFCFIYLMCSLTNHLKMVKNSINPKFSQVQRRCLQSAACLGFMKPKTVAGASEIAAQSRARVWRRFLLT